MHPTHNYRHSRRSACDRCRGQKLRCERDHVNGMSCERCLKAQEICITSVNHPTPVVLASNHDQNLVSGERESQRLSHGRESLAVLHRSSAPRVKKSLHSSPSSTLGRSTTKDQKYWSECTSMSILPGPNMIPSQGDIGFSMPLEFADVLVPFEEWSDPNFPSFANTCNPPSDLMSLDQMYSYEEKSGYPPGFPGDASPYPIPDAELATLYPLQSQPFTNGTESLFSPRDLPDPSWENYSGFATTSKPWPIPTCLELLCSTQELRKSLLKLKMALLEDLELLENGSLSSQSSYFLRDNVNVPIETLDLPVNRLLDHSSWLLGIVQSLCGTTEGGSKPACSPHLSESKARKFDESVFGAQETGGLADKDVGTISPHDSGYYSAITSPDQATNFSIPNYDIALWLGILEAHCTLVCIYRAVFTRLYQLFLIIPPCDAATILLLPNIRFGQFVLDGSLISQVQSLVEWSSTMMGEIDRGLGLRPFANQPPDDEHSVCAKDWSTSIRDIVLTQEQDPCELPLMELMERLRQLVKDPVAT